MTTEQHGSKTDELIRTALEYGARYCDLRADKWAKEALHPVKDKTDRDFRSEAEENEKAFRDRAYRMRMAAAIPSPQSPPEPGRGDDLARQERMAEVRAKIAYLEQNNLGGRHIAEIGRLSDELSRLRNEGGGGELVHIRTDRGLWRPKVEGYTNDKHDAGRWVRSEAEDMTRHLGPEKSLQLIPVDASPSDLPAREAIEREGAWVEPDENEEGEYILCIQTHAQVCIFDVGPKHFADELAKAINECVSLAALQPLSQGTGEAVAWRKALEQMWFKDSWFDLEGGTRLNFEGKTLTQIWQRLLEAFFKSDYYQALYAAPPSQPEGVREALEAAVAYFKDRWIVHRDAASKSWDCRDNNHAAADRYWLAYCLLKDYCATKAPTTTPSLGLVEAAEWQNKAIITLEAIAKLQGPAIELGPAIASGFFEARTLSAKPTAIAADREGDRDA